MSCARELEGVIEAIASGREEAVGNSLTSELRLQRTGMACRPSMFGKTGDTRRNNRPHARIQNAHGEGRLIRRSACNRCR